MVFAEPATEWRCPTCPTSSRFLLVAVGVAFTPGPNAIYLVSRSISQGRRAGYISLAGVSIGYVVYMLCAAFGVTALLLAVPYAYDALRFAGAAYLGWLAWSVLRPGGRSPFEARTLPDIGPRRLFLTGLMTNLLNPKIAVIYLSLLPQFIVPGRGAVLAQSLVLGTVQTVLNLVVNAVYIAVAGSLTAFFARRPAWRDVQRWLMGTVLAGLAVRMVIEAQR